jgi:hypothetical protein
MTRNDDPLFEALGSLPESAPDPIRAARIRARCRRKILNRGRRRRMAMRVFDGAIAAALSAYLFSVLRAALPWAIRG